MPAHMTKAKLSVIFALVMVVWMLSYLHQVMINFQTRFSLVEDVVGCEAVFEGTHVRWPEPEQTSACRDGWELREDMDGEPVSRMRLHLSNIWTIDSLKLGIVAFAFAYFMLSLGAWVARKLRR